MNIHPTAIIEDGVTLGSGTVVGPYVVIYKGVIIGPDCRIHAGAVIGDTPQDHAFKDVESGVRVGARCTIREHVTIHRGTKAGTETVVGDDCMLMANSHLAHNVRLGDKVILANGALLAGYVDVANGAFVSGNVGIHQFVRVGRLALLSGNAGISKDVPPFCITAGVHLNTVAGLNVVGLRRAGISAADRAQIKKAFEILYLSGLNVSQALERLRAEITSGPAREIAEFVDASKRGICAMGADVPPEDE